MSQIILAMIALGLLLSGCASAPGEDTTVIQSAPAPMFVHSPTVGPRPDNAPRPFSGPRR